MQTLIIPYILYMLSYLLFPEYYSCILVKYSHTWKLFHVLHALYGSYFFLCEKRFHVINLYIKFLYMECI
jgi:hypothetical protein